MLGFFQRGQPLIFVKNQKLIICLFLDKMDIKIMFDDHLVKEQALIVKKILILPCFPS